MKAPNNHTQAHHKTHTTEKALLHVYPPKMLHERYTSYSIVRHLIQEEILMIGTSLTVFGTEIVQVSRNSVVALNVCELEFHH